MLTTNSKGNFLEPSTMLILANAHMCYMHLLPLFTTLLPIFNARPWAEYPWKRLGRLEHESSNMLSRRVPLVTGTTTQRTRKVEDQARSSEAGTLPGCSVIIGRSVMERGGINHEPVAIRTEYLTEETQAHRYFSSPEQSSSCEGVRVCGSHGIYVLRWPTAVAPTRVIMIRPKRR